MNRITWTEPADRLSGQVGHITIADGRVKIASISYSVKRNDPKPWVLRTEIPGWTNARHHETREAAQESAERILTSFVRALLGDDPVVIVVDNPATVRETRNAGPNGVLLLPSREC